MQRKYLHMNVRLLGALLPSLLLVIGLLMGGVGVLVQPHAADGYSSFHELPSSLVTKEATVTQEDGASFVAQVSVELLWSNTCMANLAHVRESAPVGDSIPGTAYLYRSAGYTLPYDVTRQAVGHGPYPIDSPGLLSSATPSYACVAPDATNLFPPFCTPSV